MCRNRFCRIQGRFAVCSDILIASLRTVYYARTVGTLVSVRHAVVHQIFR